MYSQIQNNRTRSKILIGVFIGVLAAAGYIYGRLSGTGSFGLVMALAISIGMTLISWFAGDKIVLASTGAQEIVSKDKLPYLWNMVENLSITAGQSMPRIYVIQDDAINAFATGRDPKHASIAVTTGAINELENEELEGVLAHELSHVKNEDVKIMMLAAVLVGALTLLGDLFFRGSLFSRRGRDDRSNGDNNAVFMIVGVIFLILSPIIGQLIQLAISRRREYLADASGVLLTRYPEGLARALEKIKLQNVAVTRMNAATAHLWIADPTGTRKSVFVALQGLFSTHPPIDDRIEQLRKMADAR